MRALLCALLLLATDDRPLHLSGGHRGALSATVRRGPGDLGRRAARSVDRRSFLARYRQVRYLFGACRSVLDPSGLVKNRRLEMAEFARRCRAAG